jgi:hypothetical protein
MFVTYIDENSDLSEYPQPQRWSLQRMLASTTNRPIPVYHLSPLDSEQVIRELESPSPINDALREAATRYRLLMSTEEQLIDEL